MEQPHSCEGRVVKYGEGAAGEWGEVPIFFCSTRGFPQNINSGIGILQISNRQQNETPLQG